MRGRARRWTTITVLLLAALAAAELERSFLHQDDGCTVEIHCIACRLILGSTAVVTAILAAMQPERRIVSTAVLPVPGQMRAPACEARRPRGPPPV